MKPELVLQYFPLSQYFGQGQTLQGDNLSKGLSLLQVNTYVWKSLGDNTIGRIGQEVDPMSNAYTTLRCRILRLYGNNIAPNENHWGDFLLLDIIPLLDDVITVFEKELRVAGY